MGTGRLMGINYYNVQTLGLAKSIAVFQPYLGSSTDLALLADQGRTLPDYVQREFEDFLRCGILEHGFLRVGCQDCQSERLAVATKPRTCFCARAAGH